MRKKNSAAVELGRLGGKATKKRGKDFYRAIGLKGNQSQGKKVTHESE